MTPENSADHAAAEDISLDQAMAQAVTAHRAGNLTQAEAIYRQVLTAAPRHADALHLLGLIAIQVGRPADGVPLLNRALIAQPHFPEALNSLGTALKDLSRLKEALDNFDKSLSQRPDFPEALYNRGHVLQVLNRTDEAIESYRAAIAARPGYAEAYNNLGGALAAAGHAEEASQCFRHAFAASPQPGIGTNLALALAAKGAVEDARNLLDKVRARDPLFEPADALAIALLPTADKADLALIQKQRRLYHETHALALRREVPLPLPSAGRRLKVGYVSSRLDSRERVGRVLAGLAEAHDFERVALHFYSDRKPEDQALARRLAPRCLAWRNVSGLDDAALAQRIEADGIDVLVMMEGYRPRHRLLMAARKPAPIVLAWTGQGSSGLPAIDGLLTDRLVVPETLDGDCTERVLALPSCFGFPPPVASASPLPAPRDPDSPVMFGCSAPLERLSLTTIRNWAEVLSQAPQARLALRDPVLADESTRDTLRARFQAAGLEPARLDLGPAMGADFWNTIDIALDPIGASWADGALDALWMGVPVVARQLDFPEGRAAASLLMLLGLPEMVATSNRDYVRKAQRLAENRAPLAALRRALRPLIESSPLTDIEGLARRLEDIYESFASR